LVELAGRDGGADLSRSWADLRRDEEALTRQENNTRDGIAEYGPQPMFKEEDHRYSLIASTIITNFFHNVLRSTSLTPLFGLPLPLRQCEQ
jgi:hypothetical protein